MGGLILLAIGLLLIKKIRAKVKAKLINIKNGLIWNGTIRAITLGYLNYCVMWAVIIRVKFIDKYEDPTIGEYISAPIIGILLIAYPIGCLVYFIKTSN